MGNKNRKRDTLQMQQERISRHQFREFLELNEWVTGDIDHDLGEDILVQIYDKGASTGLSFYVQLKSTRNINSYILNNGVLSYRVDVADLEHWENQDPPVVLVIWDINPKTGRWELIDALVQHLEASRPVWRKQKTINIHIPSGHTLDDAGLSQIRRSLAIRLFPIIAKDHPLEIQAEFQFPTTTEGRAKLAEFERHIAAGDSVELDGRYITAFDFPMWWNRLYGEKDTKNIVLRIGPPASPEMHPARIEFFSAVYGIVQIPYVELRMVKQGQEEATLSNEHQQIPLHVWIQLFKQSNRGAIKFSIGYSSLDACAAMQALHIQQILASGGEARVTMLEINQTDIFTFGPGCVPLPAPEAITLAEKACAAQNATRTTIRFPKDGSYTGGDLIAVKEIETILKEGVYKRIGGAITVEVRKPAIEAFLEVHKTGKPLRFQLFSEESHQELLGTQIELGPMTRYITGKWEMPVEEAMSWLEQAADEDFLAVRLVDVEMIEEFQNWLNKDNSKSGTADG